MLEHLDFAAAEARVKATLAEASPAAKLHRALKSQSNLGFGGGGSVADPRGRANAAAAELCCAFLDRGQARWAPPGRDLGFLHFFAQLEDTGGSAWRTLARATAKRVLSAPPSRFGALAEGVLRENLEAMTGQAMPDGEAAAGQAVGGSGVGGGGTAPCGMTRALGATLWDMPGWAGMFQRMETHPLEQPPGAQVKLLDFCAVYTTLVRASMEALQKDACAAAPGPKGSPPAASLVVQPGHLQEAQGPPGAPSGSNVNELAAPAGTSLDGAAAPLRDEEAAHGGRGGEEEEEEEEEFHPSANAWTDQCLTERFRLEHEVEAAILTRVMKATNGPDNGLPVSAEAAAAAAAAGGKRPDMQVLTCIDDRECSFRRHLEQQQEEEEEEGAGEAVVWVETFGVAGFFDFPIQYKGPGVAAPAGNTLAPEGAAPAHQVVEAPESGGGESGGQGYARRRRRLANWALGWERAASMPLPFGLLVHAFLLPLNLIYLSLLCWFPHWKRTCAEWLLDRPGSWLLGPAPPTRVKCPTLAPGEAADRLARTLQNIGLKGGGMAPIVLVMGHGARTVNNPYGSAYNCGACGGREGGPNARLFAQCANDPKVRSELAARHGIQVPDTTWFVGAYHDTASDLVDLFDLDRAPPHALEPLKKAKSAVASARQKSALERCGKFMLSPRFGPWAGCGLGAPRCLPCLPCGGGKRDLRAEALQYVETRSTDMAEARPELCHSTNAAVVVGRRALTKKAFLARRAFLPSYDPWGDDERGTHLERVLTPALVVCSGISLEYLYSGTDGGAGTKVAMNLVGYAGVMQGTFGDLLVGLPTQMTELHPPARALFLVDAPAPRVESVLARNKKLENLVRNGWVRLIVRDPATANFSRHEAGGQYTAVNPAGAAAIKKGAAGRVKLPAMKPRTPPPSEPVVAVGLGAGKGELGAQDKLPALKGGSSFDSPTAAAAAVPKALAASPATHAAELERQDGLVPFAPHLAHLLTRTRGETRAFLASLGLAVGLALCVPLLVQRAEGHHHADVYHALYGLYTFEGLSLAAEDAHGERGGGLGSVLTDSGLGLAAALGATWLTLCALGFSRRYLHGEFMFDRFVVLSALLLLGFNLVALAPVFSSSFLAGWNLVGFSSVFLIGAYNERPTVRDSAVYVHFVFQLSDACLVAATGFWAHGGGHGGRRLGVDGGGGDLAAGLVLLSALLKASQLPVPNLFARSMEGTSAGSALGDAALAAHVGVVLLARTAPIWYPRAWARFALLAASLLSWGAASLVAKVRADRKGALGYASVASVSVIYMLLALGAGAKGGVGQVVVACALWLSLAHAAARMTQMFRAQNLLLERGERAASLGGDEAALEHLAPRRDISPWVYRQAWRLNRFNSGLGLPLDRLAAGTPRRLRAALGMLCGCWCLSAAKTSKRGQWLATCGLLCLAAAPFTPLDAAREYLALELLTGSSLGLGLAMLFGWALLSTACVWVALTHVLDKERFKRKAAVKQKLAAVAPGKLA